MSQTQISLISGSLGGFSSLALCVPSDLLKIRAQMNKETTIKYIPEIKSIIRKDGVRGLYRSMAATSLCVVPGWGFFFGAYEMFKNIGKDIIPKLNLSDDNEKMCSTLWNINAGGVASVTSWTLTMP